jgi:hypothetical protein
MQITLHDLRLLAGDEHLPRIALWAEVQDAPRQLAQVQSGPDGRFTLNAEGNGYPLSDRKERPPHH